MFALFTAEIPRDVRNRSLAGPPFVMFVIIPRYLKRELGLPLETPSQNTAYVTDDIDQSTRISVVYDFSCYSSMEKRDGLEEINKSR